MKRNVITTSDGSKTISIEGWNEQYHSKHGAIQEAYHVFIKHGLNLFRNRTVKILEIGFGTGLNALISWKEATNLEIDIHYTGIEAYPVTMEEFGQLNYISRLDAPDYEAGFRLMHSSPWGMTIDIAADFRLCKRQQDFKDIEDKDDFDLIYFDAFGAQVQPELWTMEIFQKMYGALKTHGVLVTYAAKGDVRRAMQTVGFQVERLQGPPGKREMLRATKTETIMEKT